MLLAAAIYAAMMAPWPGLERGYAWLFRTGGNIAFARYWVWPEANVRFLDLRDMSPEDLPPGGQVRRVTGAMDTLMELRVRAVSTIGHLRTSSRYTGYSPTVTTLALILAMPLVSWRKVWMVLVSMVLVHAFILARVSLTLAAAGFAADKPYALFTPSSFWSGVLTRAEMVFSDNPTVSLVVPVLIWFAVSLFLPRGETNNMPHSGKAIAE